MKHHEDFIDWLKAIGMFVIVLGHVFGPPFNQLTPPIYPKQLGVALFVFVIGWGLANERRFAWRVAWNRMFPICFWGGATAILLSLVKLWSENDLNLSNYMPFAFGVNVFANFFPANPTTWYIGTYFHIVLLWVLLFRGVSVTAGVLCLSFLVEVVVRGGIIAETGRLFTAYMVLPNWLTVLCLGMYLKEQGDTREGGRLGYLVGWVAFVSVWTLVFRQLQVGREFPFRSIAALSGDAGCMVSSLLISILYLVHTYMCFEAFRRVPAGRMVRFFSRNTIIIFLGHMPLLFALAPTFYARLPYWWLSKGLLVVVLYGGLGVLSEGVRRVVKVDRLRDMSWTGLSSVLSGRFALNGNGEAG